MQSGNTPLVVYEVTPSPMGESCSFHDYEWRTTELRAAARLLGAIVVDIDHHHRGLSAADRSHCPVCQPPRTETPAAADPTRQVARKVLPVPRSPRVDPLLKITIADHGPFVPGADARDGAREVALAR